LGPSRAQSAVESKLTCPLGTSDSASNHRLTGGYSPIAKQNKNIPSLFSCLSKISFLWLLLETPLARAYSLTFVERNRYLPFGHAICRCYSSFACLTACSESL